MMLQRTPVYPVELPLNERTCKRGEADAQPQMDVLVKLVDKVAYNAGQPRCLHEFHA